MTTEDELISKMVAIHVSDTNDTQIKITIEWVAAQIQSGGFVSVNPDPRRIENRDKVFRITAKNGDVIGVSLEVVREVLEHFNGKKK